MKFTTVPATAAHVLGLMKSHNLHSSTFEGMSGNFSEIRQATKEFQKGVLDVVMSSAVSSVHTAMLPVFTHQKGIRGRAMLLKWLGEVEALLENVAEKQEPINTATALLAGDLCRLIEKRGLGGGMPLVSMLEHVPLLNPVARNVRGELFTLIAGKNGVSPEDAKALNRLVDHHCGGYANLTSFNANWKEAHHKLGAIALGAKP